ncbi:hypothetical protein BH18ACT6_BH18ACT6_08650 [soil metagenome]
MAATDRIGGYASALFDLATAEGDNERTERELHTIAQALSNSDELREALNNPGLPFDRKQAIIGDLLGGKASDLVRGMVSFIIGQGRGADLGAIVENFIAQSAASRSKAVAEIRSAIPLDQATVDRLARALSSATGKDLEVTVVVDPDVIGGIIAKVGDVVFDGSVARRLSSVRQALKKTG